MALTYAKEKTRDINGPKTLHNFLISAAIRMPGNIGLSGHIAVKITGRLI
jgi:hypothetical protein